MNPLSFDASCCRTFPMDTTHTPSPTWLLSDHRRFLLDTTSMWLVNLPEPLCCMIPLDTCGIALTTCRWSRCQVHTQLDPPSHRHTRILPHTPHMSLHQSSSCRYHTPLVLERSNQTTELNQTATVAATKDRRCMLLQTPGQSMSCSGWRGTRCILMHPPHAGRCLVDTRHTSACQRLSWKCLLGTCDMQLHCRRQSRC